MKTVTLLVFTAALGVAAIRAETAPPAEPHFDGLGKPWRKITTTSAEAQRYFDQGLAFLYAFDHEEAIRSFQAAAQADPDCAMAWWGIACASGPHINFPLVTPDRLALAMDALAHAQKAAAKASPVEQALIAAQAKRYASPQPENRHPLDEAYANAMRDAWKQFSRDADVGVLFAESLLDLRPWDQWKPDGSPQPGTEEVLATLKAVSAIAPDHPHALHLTIHAYEASPHPEQADAAAERLRDLQPGLGHMVHMPSHIDVLRNRWAAAVAANEKAVAADAAYRAKVKQPLGLMWMYMAHNRHMLAYAAMMSGRSALALRHVRAMAAEFPAEFVKGDFAPVADFFMAVQYEVMVRFGRWDEILAESAPSDEQLMPTALWHSARTIALTVKERLTEARVEFAAFRAARAKIPADVQLANNSAQGILAVAESMAEGELLFREGKREEGLKALREAVAHDDALRYDEPPDWMLPARHALGAALLQADQPAEAEQAFRADLVKHPGNGWALYGLARSLHLQGKHQEAKAADGLFRAAWKDADFELTSPCLCQPGK